MRVAKETILEQASLKASFFLRCLPMPLHIPVQFQFVVSLSFAMMLSSFLNRVLRSSRIFVLHFAMALSAGVFVVSNAAASDLSEQSGLASIDFVKGYATVFPRNDSSLAIFAKRGMEIGELDVIITGDDGFVSLSLAGGTVVSIQPDSRVFAEKLDCPEQASVCRVTLDAIQGSINANVGHEGGTEMQFRINTPYASAAVRGTVFDIDVNQGRLLAGVTEGRVDVSSEAGAVELPENFGTSVQQNQPPSPPKPLLSAPALIPGPPRYDSGGELQWNQVALASGYLVSLVNQDGLVYRTRSDETTHTMEPLEVGTHAAQIRAIDEEGFLGSVAQREFDIVRTRKSVPGPDINVTISESEFAVTVEQQPRIGDQVELHFSTSENFDLLSTIDVPLTEVVSSSRADNTIYVRARGVISNTDVTPFGPTIEIPRIQ